MVADPFDSGVLEGTVFALLSALAAIAAALLNAVAVAQTSICDCQTTMKTAS